MNIKQKPYAQQSHAKGITRCIARIVAVVICLNNGINAAPIRKTEFANDLVIGQSLPLSGAAATSSQQARLGVDVYFAHINALGGVHGAKIRHVVLDDGDVVEAVVRNARQFIDIERAVALVDFSNTEAVEQLQKQNILTGANVALVGLSGGSESVRLQAQSNVFHIRAGYADESENLVSHLATLGVRRVAVFRKDDRLGRDGLAGVKTALTKRNLKLEGDIVFNSGNGAVASAVRAFVASDPEAIVLMAGSGTVAAFAKQYRESGGKAHLLCVSDVDNADVLKLAGVKVVQGMSFSRVVPHPFSGDRLVVREYQSLLLRYGPMDAVPSYSGLESFISAKVLVEALRRSGPNPSSSEVVSSLEQLGDFDVGGFHVNYSKTRRSGSRYVDFTILDRDGKLRR